MVTLMLRPALRTALPLFLPFALSFVALAASAQPQGTEHRITALMQQMTLEEKIGQLNILSGETQATGPVTFRGDHATEIRAGRTGSMLNVVGTNSTRQYQEQAMQSRLKIPLLFGQDVIHGYLTTFPIPLAEAASWDLPARPALGPGHGRGGRGHLFGLAHRHRTGAWLSGQATG